MKKAAILLTGLVAIIHIYIFVLEAFLWQTDYGLKTFGNTPERAATTAVLAINQGFYNLALAAGLVWSFFIADHVWKRNIRLFFLGLICVMGIAGAATAMVRILFIQSLPALLGALAVWLDREQTK